MACLRWGRSRPLRAIGVAMLALSLTSCGLPRLEAINKATESRQLSGVTDELLCSPLVRTTPPVAAERQQRGLGDCKVFWEYSWEHPWGPNPPGPMVGGAGNIVFIPFMIQDLNERGKDLQTVSSATCPWFPGKTVSNPGCPNTRKRSGLAKSLSDKQATNAPGPDIHVHRRLFDDRPAAFLARLGRVRDRARSHSGDEASHLLCRINQDVRLFSNCAA